MLAGRKWSHERQRPAGQRWSQRRQRLVCYIELVAPEVVTSRPELVAPEVYVSRLEATSHWPPLPLICHDYYVLLIFALEYTRKFDADFAAKARPRLAARAALSRTAVRPCRAALQRRVGQSCTAAWPRSAARPVRAAAWPTRRLTWLPCIVPCATCSSRNVDLPFWQAAWPP